MSCPQRIDVAAYLLDALEPPESDLVREHVVICQECRTEYIELCGVPIMLSILTSAGIKDIVAPTELPEDLCDAVIARAAAHRRKHARYRLLAISVAVVLVGILAAFAITGRQAPAAQAPAAVTVSATDPDTHVHASAGLTPYDWGTQIRLELTGVPLGQQCMLIVHSVDGHQDTAATWTATYRGGAGFLIIIGSTAIPSHRIGRMDIVTTSNVRLVVLPPPR